MLCQPASGWSPIRLRLVADKAYDAERLRDWPKARRTKAVIPSAATRTVPYGLDRKAHRRRNQIERSFCRLKNWRRVATRLMIASHAISCPAWP